MNRCFAFLMLSSLAGCSDDAVPLQVKFEWTTYCSDDQCNLVPPRCCAEVRGEIEGKNGDALPRYSADSEIGLSCAIVTSSDGELLSELRVQNDALVNSNPNKGILLRRGSIAVGSSMVCPEDQLSLFDNNEFTGTCGGDLSPGNCQILVRAFDLGRGRLELEIECLDLTPPDPDGTPRSIKNSLLTVQGCDIVEDPR